MKKLVKFDLKKKYLFSFVLVSIVPIVIIIALLYIPIEDLFKKEVIKSDTIKSQQIRDIVDMRVSEISGLSVQMSTDKRIKEMLYKSQPLDNITNYSFKDVVDILATYKASNNFISYIGIYFLQSSSVVTEEGKYTDDSFFERVLLYEGMDSALTKQDFSKAYFNKFLPLRQVKDSSTWEEGKYITFVQTIPIGDKRPLANIIMLIDEKSMLSAIGETKSEHDERVLVLTGNEEIISSKGDNEKLKPALLERMKEGSDSFILNTSEHKQMIVSYAKSSVTGWNYIVLSNMEDILSQVNNIRNRALFIAIICLVIAFLLSALMTRYSYSPWKNLVNFITAGYSKSHNGGSCENEYLYARGAFENILLEKEKLKSDIEKRKNYIKNYALQNLCTGKNTNLEEIENIDAIFPYNTFCVILADIDSDTKLIAPMFKFITRLVGTYYDNTSVFCFEDEKDRLCIILNTSLKEKEALLRHIKRLKDKLGSHLGFLLYAGVGNIYDSPGKLKDSYSEACRALEYCFLKGEDSMVFFPEIQKHIFSVLYFPVHSENPLLNSVKAGDFKACSRLLDEYFNSITSTGNASTQYMYYLFYNFVSVVIKVCGEIHADFEKVFDQTPEQLLDISKFRNIKQMMGNVYNIYEVMCSYVQKNKSAQNVGLKVQIERFINQRYSDKNASLIELSDELGYSSSYLSRFINQQFGTGFGDLLNKTRLDMAKKLLSTTMNQINEIADAAGYASINSFIRTFKRIEGITPGQYREILALKDTSEGG